MATQGVNVVFIVFHPNFKNFSVKVNETKLKTKNTPTKLSRDSGANLVREHIKSMKNEIRK